MDEADGSKICDLFRTTPLRKENDICCIEEVEPLAATFIEESINSPDDILFDDRPALTEENSGETIGAWGFVRRDTADCIKDLLVRKRI